MDSSSIVIKVKYGETLRRFSASLHDKKLVLDIVMLREKIRALFSFDADVDFTLTYIDEDGDVVTLADNDDLHDAVRQSLNPLRITLKLNGKHGGLGETSAPLRSPQDQLNQALNSGFSEFLKSVPESLRDPLTKLPLELASKATSSTPVLAELIESMKTLYLNQISNAMAGPKANGTTGGSSNMDGGKGKKSESSTVKDGKVVDPEVGSSNLKKKGEKAQKMTEGVKFKDARPIRPVDLNLPFFENEAFLPPFNAVNEGANGQASDIPSEKNKDMTDGVEKGKASGVEYVSVSDKKKDVSIGSSSGAQSNPAGCANLSDYLRQYVHGKVTEVGASSSVEYTKVTNDSGSSSGWARGMLDAANQCPFVGMPLPSDSNLHGYHHSSRSPHWKRYSHGNGIGSVTFHRGVRCDGCGVHPITGPRFKSKVKEDYDLCSVCFTAMGNVSDYIRMDRPANGFRHQIPFKGFHDPSLRFPPPTLPHALRAPGAKLPRVKLDSRFILDVNVLDGTIMAPFTAFTKIWRMRNNGTVIWPCGSQLQWIGGDRLSSAVTVDVEIPADGLPVDKELDIAVDFTAPELPGRYISYWRMASPTGQKFGQRVWVLIQVDASMKDLGETSFNLNLPPVTRNPEFINQDHLMESILPENIIRVTDSEDTSVDPQPKDQEMNFPINDTLIINNGGVFNTSTTLTPPVGPARSSVFNSTQVEAALASLPLGPSVSSGFLSTGVVNPWVGPSVSSVFFTPEESDRSSFEPVTYPTVDSTELPPAAVSAAPLPTVSVMQPSSAANADGSDHEQVLVRELQDMGFKELDLNKEILRMNNYDLEKSIDDLCGVSEWDPMLDELQEMGFADNETNRRLLKKNNGSIKRVVMDLINGEQA